MLSNNEARVYSSNSESSKSTPNSIWKFPDWIPDEGSAESGGEDRQVYWKGYAHTKSLSYDGSSLIFSFFSSPLGTWHWLVL